MATRYWMISTRKPVDRDGARTLGTEDEERVRFFSCPLSVDAVQATSLATWTEHVAAEFRRLIIEAAGNFPLLEDGRNQEQKHVTLFVHGYNNTWNGAFGRYRKLVQDLYAGDAGLGECILFTWPSNGSTSSYLPDRRDAKNSADDLVNVLSWLYDWLIRMQQHAADGAAPDAAAFDSASVATAAVKKIECRAKTSIIAHSMGGYLAQCAMQDVWTRKNKPLLTSLINQLLLVSADVDNDLFASGESIGERPGEGIANLAYRVTCLYSGLDQVLGLSAGLKHFGKRRLGRSGLDRSKPLPDNVWDVDVTTLYDPKLDHGSYHSAAFDDPRTVDLMRQLLRGIDRRILVANHVVPGQDRAVTPLTGEGTAPAA